MVTDISARNSQESDKVLQRDERDEREHENRTLALKEK